jgi:hypothetical protein
VTVRRDDGRGRYRPSLWIDSPARPRLHIGLHHVFQDYVILKKMAKLGVNPADISLITLSQVQSSLWWEIAR